MQKARRFMCPTASESAASSVTARTGKKSRPSSAGGESVAAGTAFENKSKTRSTKCSIRILPSVLKNAKKTTKGARPPRPNFGSLQNAVVLAPFYTLKRCYQNKLVDLYANEKMKKMNQKMKMAKKQNMSFEYDIIELKPLTQMIKKETKPTKKQQEQQQQKQQEQQQVRSRSASYCQCKKDASREGGTSGGSKQEKKAKEAPSPRVPCFSGHLMAKRRKLNPGTATPRSLKCELTPGFDLRRSGANFCCSARSSGSKCESWESCSNSPSCKEEHLQGSLAISNTSFDSYFENFDKAGWCGSDAKKKDGERTKKARARMQLDADFLSKPVTKNFIANVEGKGSDGEIADFMDREPQSYVISAVESNQNWQPPLRRRSRVKRKKQESEAVAGYYLRSLSPGNDRESRTFLPANRQECRYACGSASSKSKSVQVEMVGQAEGSASDVPGPRLSSSKRGQRESTPDDPCADAPEEKSPEEPTRDSTSGHEGSAVSLEHIPEVDPNPPEADPADDPSECFPSRMSGATLSLLEDRPELSQRVELVAGLNERFPEAADSRQPRDRDSGYIFGARNNGSGVGESCEFSFGLKWVFSDDDD